MEQDNKQQAERAANNADKNVQDGKKAIAASEMLNDKDKDEDKKQQDKEDDAAQWRNEG